MVDFIVNDVIVIEVDGERWHDKEKDSERDSILKSFEFSIYRFSAKDIIRDVTIINRVLG